MAKEVARYNAMAQNAQSQHHAHHQLHNSVLVRAKGEILRIIELLVDKIPNEVADLLVEVSEVLKSRAVNNSKFSTRIYDHNQIGKYLSFPILCLNHIRLSSNTPANLLHTPLITYCV